MPKWIHDRADHIRAKNPGMPKSESFAIATQQAHASGHTPKGYGTKEGKQEAKQKYDEPKGAYEPVADPKTKTAHARLVGFCDELEKIAALAPPKVKIPGNVRVGATSIPRELPAPVPMTDVLAQTKMSPPPPVTAGR